MWVKERVKYHMPETTLYRLLQKRSKSYRYRNSDLYSFKEILLIPELSKDLSVNETDE